MARPRWEEGMGFVRVRRCTSREEDPDQVDVIDSDYLIIKRLDAK